MMDSDQARNQAIFEVKNNQGASNTNTWNSTVREKYEVERTYQEKLKEGK
jgi:hypothetical protein